MVGLTYLLVILPAVFAEFHVPGQLVVYDDAMATAQNIIANERLFRLGVASNLIVFALDVVLITALYVVLRPVDRTLALLATSWRLIETAILAVTLLNDLDVLRFLSGASYLRVIEPEHLSALARASIGAHGSGYNMGLMFAGLGSSMFCYLWFRSGYIPKLLAGWGVFASVLLMACTFAFIIFPNFSQMATIEVYGGPIFVFEVAIGVWLLVKGLRPSKIAES